MAEEAKANYLVTELANDPRMKSVYKTIQINQAVINTKNLNDPKNFISYQDVFKIHNDYKIEGKDMQIMGILPAGITRPNYQFPATEKKPKTTKTPFTTLKHKNDKHIKQFDDPNYWTDKVMNPKDFEKFVSIQIIYWEPDKMPKTK
jgi:hypothetical protein